jgi:dGTPase
MKKKSIFYDYEDSLAHVAFDSKKSLGRRFSEEEDSDYDILDPYLRDREKIRLSKSYRRLADKTQVFPPALHSNVRNRLIHTDDVVNLSTVSATILGLNVYLAEAIAYGHDIGHAPFGHLGEKLICQLTGKNFTHNVMSVIVAEKVERKGMGINLTFESLEGMKNHSSGIGEVKNISYVSQEANLVKHNDKFAYTFSDLNDSIRVGFLKEKSIPESAKYFGNNQRERVVKITYDFVKESSEEGKVSFSKSESALQFAELRNWMFKNVYLILDEQDYRMQIIKKFEKISDYICLNYDGKIDPYFALCCMTDSEVNNLYHDLNNGGVQNHNYGFVEIIQNFYNKEIDIFDSDLNKKDFKRVNL